MASSQRGGHLMNFSWPAPGAIPSASFSEHPWSTCCDGTGLDGGYSGSFLPCPVTSHPGHLQSPCLFTAVSLEQPHTHDSHFHIPATMIPDRNSCSEERFILAHGFRGPKSITLGVGGAHGDGGLFTQRKSGQN